MTIGVMEIRLHDDPAGAARARRFAITGALDEAAARDLTARIWSDGGHDSETVVIDLTGVTSVDVEALETLFALRDLLGQRLRIDTAGGRIAGRRARHGRSPLARR
jgi:hypothetical protein